MEKQKPSSSNWRPTSQKSNDDRKARLNSKSFLRNVNVGKNHGRYFLGKIKDFNINKRNIKRAGIIVYTTIESKIYFMLGIDEFSGDLTDFGGGIQSRDKGPINCALREYEEETIGTIHTLNEESLKNCNFISSNTMLIIFVPLKFDHTKVFDKFNRKIENRSFSEVLGLVLLDGPSFIKLIFPKISQDEMNYMSSNNKILEGNKLRIYNLVSDFIGTAIRTTKINFFDML